MNWFRLKLLSFLIICFTQLQTFFKIYMIGMADDCTEELVHFKRLCSTQSLVDIGDIGLEDYFLMFHLIYLIIVFLAENIQKIIQVTLLKLDCY